FMESFKPPTVLMFALGEDAKPWAAGWFKPFSTSALVGAWVREDMRKTLKSIEVAHFYHQAGFKLWPTLISITRHEYLLKLHRNWGFQIVGKVPSIVDSEDAWILYLTEENYKQSKVYQEL
ncbi:MAG: hypothetical protein ACXABY_34700, partial [Candidatus Thorarchaeota archaeon]